MTWNRTLATGSGELAFRLSIEGLDVDAVTARSLEMSAAETDDGRARRTGLSVKGTKLSQRADLVYSTIEAKGITVSFADVDGVWTETFASMPTATTWMWLDATASDTTLTVKSTAAFASGEQYVWVDSECMRVETDDPETFAILERGCFDTLPQAHYATGGAIARAPAVTNRPVLWTGRRARLYVYGRGDSRTGPGTQIWLGVLTGEPRAQGPTWQLSIDPISSLLEQEVGADLGPPVTPRGIYLPATGNGPLTANFLLRIQRNPYAGVSPVPLPERGVSADALIPMIGFWETQADFLAELQSKITAETAGWAATITVAPYPVDGSYRFQIYPHANPDGIRIQLECPTEPYFDGSVQAGDGGLWDPSAEVDVMAAGGDYFAYPNPTRTPIENAGQVPRGIFNARARFAQGPANRVYLGGSVALTDNTTAVLVQWHDAGGTTDAEYVPFDFDTAARRVDLSNFAPLGELGRAYTPANLPTIRLGRSYNDYSGDGTYSLLKTIEDDCAEQLNTGAIPLWRSEDWNATEWLAGYDGVSAYASQRRYSSLKPVKLRDFVCPDLQLAGRFLAFDGAGRLTIRPLRLAAPTETTTFQITKANLLTDEGFPTYERGAIGQYNTIEVQDGYSATTDEHTLLPVKVRDVAAYGMSPIARTIRIETKSSPLGGVLSPEDIVAVGAQVLGIFGAPYAYIQCAVPLTALSGEATTLGSTVSISTAQLPSSRGTRGVTDLAAIVVARDIDLYGARVELTLLASLARIAGYAFGALITSHSNTSGNVWEIEVYGDYFGGTDTAEDHVEPLDDLEVYRFDSATAGTQHCTVQSVSGNILTVQFDSTWTPGSDEWALTQVDADNVDESPSSNQRRYCYVAGSDARIAFDGTPEDARVFAP